MNHFSVEEKLKSTLAECQLDFSREGKSFSTSLQSLYDFLLDLFGESTAAGETYDRNSCNFRQYIAEHLIYNMNRPIVSLDQEIEGSFLHDNSSYNWTDVADPRPSNVAYNNGIDQTERLLDRCLDLCGYAITLEVAVDCLRKVVRLSYRKSRDISSKSNETEVMPNLPAVVTSLRTIRRRLLVVPHELISTTEHLVRVINAAQLKPCLQELVDQDMQQKLILAVVILPLEYYKSIHSTSIHDEFLLTDSLVSLATSVVPALISSACHAMKLHLPIWASRQSDSHLLNSAFGMTLCANKIKHRVATKSQKHNDALVDIHSATSEYCESLIKHTILNRDGIVAVRLLYQVWNCVEVGGQLSIIDPRSILRSHLDSVLSSISSKKEVASFVRGIVRYVVSKNQSRFTKRPSVNNEYNQSQLDGICREKVLPILDYFLRLALSRDVILREAVVNFAVLSPPSSFKANNDTFMGQQSLNLIDHLIPRCISMLLHSACNQISETEVNVEEDSISFLNHTFTVTAVWCEEIFVSKTDPLQQQHITEFLLYPLENKIFTEETIQLALDESGTSLATMFIQGVSLRLEVSRSDSIRKDGMRVAEAMSVIFGQTLRFDELHPPVIATESQTPEKKSKKMEAKRDRREPKFQVVVDPDAEYFSDDSTSSKSYQSESTGSSSDASFWGESSLQPYNIDDDEEDLSPVPRPRCLRDCVAYLLTNHEDREAYDKHEAALKELPSLVSSKPLDLIDVVPTLARVLLHMEDKFNMNCFIENRWDSLMACAIQAPIETSFKLVDEMKGHVSLGTRLEALSILGCTAEELSGITFSNESKLKLQNEGRHELTQMSTRLRKTLAISDKSIDSEIQKKSRRWRQRQSHRKSTPNMFNAISAQIILSLFAFLGQTKNDNAIWGGPLGERFLSEFLRTLSRMIDCARSYPSTRVFASDLFELAWSFHDAKNSEVRRSVLMAIATSVSVDPVGQVNKLSNLIPYLANCSSNDTDEGCRVIALSLVGSLEESYRNTVITEL